MPSQRPPGRGSFPPRGPRPTSGHAGARRPKPATGGPSDRKGPQARREAKPFRAATTAGPRPAPKPRGTGKPPAAGSDRLQKILAHAGVGSRRACEELILQGRVTVGGHVIKELGTKVDLGDKSVAVDGQKIQQERLVYFAVNKPKGYVSTNNDPSGRPRVLDLLPEMAQRVYTVGRLDEMSVGLMLLTNDGELANKLAHPKFGVEKLYRVIVAGTPERETLNQLTEGIWLAEGKVRAKRVRAVAKKGDATILELVLAEGKNREVRRMLAKLGHKVMMLTRVAVGPITLKGLAAGQCRPLTGREVDLLRRVAAGEPVPMPWATADRRPRPEMDRPRRPFGAGPGGPADRRPVRDERDGPNRFGPRPPQAGSDRPPARRDQDRPHGPGYRGDGPPQDRRPGPPGGYGRPMGGPPPRAGGPPRRPGMFQPPIDDSIGRDNDDRRPPQGGDRRADGPRPYQRQDGRPQGPRPGGPRPYQRNDGPQGGGRPGGPRPYQRQDGPQGGPRGAGPGGPRPYQRNDGPQGGPRPGGPGPYQRNDGPQGGPRPGGPGGPRPYQRNDGPQGGPRPYQRQDGPQDGGHRPHQRQDGPQGGGRFAGGPQGRPPYQPDGDSRPPRPGQRPGGDRPPGNNGPRPSPGGPRRFDNNDRRPSGPNGGGGDRRPRPNGRPVDPNSFEPRRKVIGLGPGPSQPPPQAPTPPQDAADDRPKSRMKRPAPRGAAPSSRPMPKRRIARRDDD